MGRAVSLAFAAIAPQGWVYFNTIRYRARDARTAMGELLIGMKLNGRNITTAEEGWAEAKRGGYRIRKVDVVRLD